MESLLKQVQGPDDLKRFDARQLEGVAAELREAIIEHVSHTGGHLAANLGVVELTVALLRVFSPPVDKIIWDTSHQTYAYKMLTGRRDRMETLRQFGGLSGFLNRDESPCDAFGAGHAGTALSAGLGMAVARDRLGGKESVVVVLGDGSAGCGISFEALNNLAGSTRQLIVVLNDNKMSIDANVGAMSRYLGSLLTSPRYNRWKRTVEQAALQMRMGALRGIYYRLEEALKSLFVRNVLFEEFGLRYIGPVNGHNLPALLDALQIAAESDKPILLHVATQKGRGYAYAEDKPGKWHGTQAFDVETGEPLEAPGLPGYSSVFGTVMEQLGGEYPNLVAVTAAMAAGTGLTRFKARYPERFFDVGISEEHAVIFAAGMAARGLVPVVAIYSTFFQRSVDCVIHDVCLQKLPVIFCLDRAGIVGEDGPTHHGVFDIALLRTIPGLVIMQPADEAELAAMLKTAVLLKQPVVIRYPKGPGSGKAVPLSLEPLPLGQAGVVREGHDIQIWALGDRVARAIQAADELEKVGIHAGVVNARFVQPLDEALLMRQASVARCIVTLENGNVAGGFGEVVRSALARKNYRGEIRLFGWPQQFIPHGSQEILEATFGQDVPSIVSFIREWHARPVPTPV